MANAKNQLLDFLDQRVFDPILDASVSDYSDEEEYDLIDVQQATETEKKRFRSYNSAEKVKEMFQDNLSSGPAQEIHQKLERLNLPSLPKLRDEFMQLADQLEVK